MAVFGLIYSWWAILCLPVAVLIGYAFSGAGLGASSFMRSFIDFDFVNLAILPMFLLSATFFPLSQYPEGVQWIVRLTPLYQGVALERAFVFGELQWSLLLNVLYLVVDGQRGPDGGRTPPPPAVAALDVYRLGLISAIIGAMATTFTRMDESTAEQWAVIGAETSKLTRAAWPTAC